MKPEKVATREDWLIARKALLVREKEHTRQKDEITRARQALPWVKVEKDYVFDTSNGPRRLADLFEGCSQLITYHFMFGPNWENPCKSCSFWADSYHGLGPHLAAQDITLIAVSSAPLERLLPFKERMGWDFEWVSSHRNSFNVDYDVGFGAERPKELPNAYNFGTLRHPPLDEMHGTSVFAKDDDGNVYHTYSTYGRGLDATNAAYAYIDLTPKARDGEPTSGNSMGWLKYHDCY